MTREQVETEMAQYRTIVTVVRLLDAAQVGGEESINSFCSCYSYWGKNTPCRNCISRQVLEDHRQRTKLEYMGSEVFQVTAVYREVDGVPCVMELVQKLPPVGGEQPQLLRKSARLLQGHELRRRLCIAARVPEIVQQRPGRHRCC